MSQDKQQKVVLGVIGGSGIYKMPGIEIITEHEIKTSFGAPSAAVIEGKIEEKTVFFLPRHGLGHTLTPTEVPYRANIAALKQCGVTHLIAVSAVGIMRPDIKPGDMLVPDQIIDWTKGFRKNSFFEDGAVGHLMFADPFCSELRSWTLEAAGKIAANVHDKVTYVCIEGPRFSSRAESEFFRRTMDPGCIGMTAHPEAPLAKEAGLSYAMLALATDYDCWHETEEDVSVDAVLKVLHENTDCAQKIVREILTSAPKVSTSRLPKVGEMLITDKSCIPSKTSKKLQELFGSNL